MIDELRNSQSKEDHTKVAKKICWHFITDHVCIGTLDTGKYVININGDIMEFEVHPLSERGQ